MARPPAAAILCALSFAGAAACSPARAQSFQVNPDPRLTDLSQYLLPENRGATASAGSTGAQPTMPSYGNFSFVRQNGMNNQATVDLTGAGNATTQIQIGRGNKSAVSVAGGQNAVTTIQAGNNDSSTISLTGQGNEVLNSQIGSNLSYGLQQIGNGKTVTVQQFGVK